tara:strand:- start:199 stop:1686 length:1488 start_codon:yes stop_codon:yes gene_type:complete
MKFIKFLLIAYFTIKCTSTFGYCQSIEPLLSFKIDSQLRVFENRDKLSPSVNNDILYIVENYHEGGYSYLSGSNLETKTRSRDDYGVLYAYNIKTGKKIWSVDLKSPAATSPSIGDDGNAYIATKGWPRKLHCIDKSGNPLWSYRLSEKVYSAPAIGKDGTLYFGSDDGLFYAVNSNGAKEWSYPADGIIRFSPVIGSDGTIYFGSNDDNFYAVTPEGKLKWKYYSATDVKGSAAIGADGVIYFCTDDTKLHALNPNGESKWVLKLFRKGSSGTPAIGSNDVIYAVSDYGVHAVDMNGKELWKKKLSGNYDYNPSIGFENTIVLGNRILSGLTGETIKTLEIKKDTILIVYESPEEWHQSEEQPEIYTGAGTVIGDNGNIYFSDSSFNYYCYKVPEFGIADSSWPMLGATPSRNSNFNSSPGDDQIKITSFTNDVIPFSITFESKSASTYKIEASHDLKKWDAIGEAQGTGTAVKFTDLREALFQKQYYRVKKVE